jgi:hypothetical protein
MMNGSVNTSWLAKSEPDVREYEPNVRECARLFCFPDAGVRS